MALSNVMTADMSYLPVEKIEKFKTSMIDLETIYPFLATVATLARRMQVGPIHPALTHQIINDPNPGSRNALGNIPGTNKSATIIRLGPKRVSPGAGSEWWPKAYNHKVRFKLSCRIQWEGNTFWIHFATCLALLTQVYVRSRDVRLKYRSSPIADFGLAVGRFRVMDQDKLAYVLPDGKALEGQDYENHYWIYFITARGEELTLDFGTYTWNLCTVIKATEYDDEGMIDMAPATFRNRMMTRAPFADRLYTERARFSVLRDPMLAGADMSTFTLGNPQNDHPAISAWSERVRGREMTEEERRFAPNWCVCMSKKLRRALASGDWKRWPETVNVGMDLDPLEEFEVTGVMPGRN
ncbi:hypothetical protein FRB99_004252 [Tulasnella sp. 403]|nr:hypothetical protein FRB99_004252 [Tulasnella sp. 403]